MKNQYKIEYLSLIPSVSGESNFREDEMFIEKN